MSRKKIVITKRIDFDAKFNSDAINKFINKLMVTGKKSTAEGIFYSAMERVEEITKENPMDVFNRALDNVKPYVEVKSRRVGGSTYQVPVEVNPDRRIALATRWMIGYSRDRKEKTMAHNLASEIIDASKKQGGSVKKKEDTHKMAEANKAFAHYRW
ncbi:MAG: 30S ribosomal protein S7 [bacterium]|nr:30S ribosomal protein S7 [bacterium]